MKNVTQGLVAAAIVAGTVWTPREAFALGPVDLEAAVLVGGGTSTIGSSALGANPNPLGFGFGARAGVGIFGFYGGVTAQYYVGESVDNAAGHYHMSSSLAGLEGGYNFGLAMLTVRPQLGLGYYNAGGSYPIPQGIGMVASGSYNSGSVYLEPGVTGLLSFGMWIVGADANLLWVPAVDNSQIAVVIHGQFGIKL
jgi:hypothetical protein